MAKISIDMQQATIQQQATTPQKRKSVEKKIIVGIDLGTTNSLVAFIDPNTQQPTTITDTKGSNQLLPSVVYVPPTGEMMVGNSAADKLISEPENTIYSAKRLMGKSYEDLKTASKTFNYTLIENENDADKLVKVKVGERFYSPVEISAFILQALKQRAESLLQQTIQQAVITVPAYFNDTQRQATRNAGKLAGLEVLRIVNEPTAAALAYGFGADASQEAKTVAVYDLGGGTFDISILSIDNGIFEVLATHGNTFLGGDDFDQAIVQYWLAQNADKASAIDSDFTKKQRLRLLAEQAKKVLSDNEVFKGSFIDWDVSISASTFKRITTDLVNTTLQACQTALQDAELTPADIDEVILVGGSTRMPIVKAAVSQFFTTNVNDSLNPDEVVALGAAVQADILAGNQHQMLLLDVTPLSLGIETAGGLMDVIIPRNTTLPTSASRQYTTQKDGQANMRIAIYQGERDLVQHNRKLGHFELRGIPAMPAGLPKVDISFIIDADGILQVKAKELRSGVEQEIMVSNQYGLSEKEMAKMLIDSLQFAKDDMSARALLEAKNEAENVMHTTERFIKKNAAQLSNNEIEHTKALLADLKNALKGEHKDEILQALEALNHFTTPFAQRIMDSAIGEALKGKTL